jgi:hypothetical protein
MVAIGGWSSSAWGKSGARLGPLHKPRQAEAWTPTEASQSRVGFACLGDGFGFRAWARYTSLHLFAFSHPSVWYQELVAVVECLMIHG